MERNLHPSLAGSNGKGRPSSWDMAILRVCRGGVQQWGGGELQGSLSEQPLKPNPSSWLRTQHAGNLMFLPGEEAGLGSGAGPNLLRLGLVAPADEAQSGV